MPQPNFARRHNFQNFAWINDLFDRRRLEMDPPYQRRSVWNQRYREDFVDTVLLQFPCPSIFLYEEVLPDGRQSYAVVDGKQRLLSLLEFVRDTYPVGDKSLLEQYRGSYFSALPDEVKSQIWQYSFTIEYVPTDNEALISQVFDRINRNVAKLTSQELRHAKFDGKFIKACEELTEELNETLPKIPQMSAQVRWQMKDVETVANLLLLLEEGPMGRSSADLDVAFANRDETWDKELETTRAFHRILARIQEINDHESHVVQVTRLKNQADFYSLFGSLHRMSAAEYPGADIAASRLLSFMQAVGDEALRAQNPMAKRYFEAARSASNDTGPRRRRTAILRAVIKGEVLTDDQIVAASNPAP